MTIITIDATNSRKAVSGRGDSRPWVFKTFGVFFFGTLCVSLTQFVVSVSKATPPPSIQDQLEISKESFRNEPADPLHVPPLDDHSIAPGFREFRKQQAWLQSNYVRDDDTETQQPRPNYYVIFSTSCSLAQHWESYVFFYHAYKVQQPGNVTRIVSGCSTTDQEREQHFFDEYIRPMRDGFQIHFTPDFGSLRLAKGQYYKYMNKPFGVRHWMEHVLGMNPQTMEAPSQQVDDGIVFLLDPDFVLLRPIGHDFSDAENHIWAENNAPTRVVKHGYPIAQQDGYLTNQWMQLDMGYITNQTANEYVPFPPLEHGGLYYNSGPPYLATVRDMYKIAARWTEYAPRVVDVYPELFAEMTGLIYATLQLKLPFTLIKSLTVSWTKQGRREGWPFIDRLPDDQICDPPASARLPISMHYCKQYNIGKWFWSKYRIKENILDCENSLLEMPPPDLVSQNITYRIEPPGQGPDALAQFTEKQIPLDRPWQSRREPFMLCHLTRAVNEALVYHKHKACADGGNLAQNYTVYKDPYIR